MPSEVQNTDLKLPKYLVVVRLLIHPQDMGRVALPFLPPMLNILSCRSKARPLVPGLKQINNVLNARPVW